MLRVHGLLKDAANTVIDQGREERGEGTSKLAAVVVEKVEFEKQYARAKDIATVKCATKAFNKGRTPPCPPRRAIPRAQCARVTCHDLACDVSRSCWRILHDTQITIVIVGGRHG